MDTRFPTVSRTEPVYRLPAQSGMLSSIGPFSMYRGVIVLWTDRYDVRVLTWIDELDDVTREALIAVCAHKGTIELLWADGHRHVDEWVFAGGDTWSVDEQWDARTGAPCA